MANFEYNSPTPGRIPIVASTAWINPAKNVPSFEMLDQIEKCGINTIFLPISSSNFNEVKKILEKTSLKILIHHGDLRPEKKLENNEIETGEQIKERIINILRYNKILDYVAGWDFYDEPTYNQLAATGPRSLKFAYDCIYDDDKSGKFVFINLVGDALSKYMDYHTYEQYVEILQNNFTPALYCFDLYPIYIDGSLKVEYKKFYYDLELFSKYSKSNNRPFWIYCQAAAWYNTTTSRYYPEIEESYLRFAVFSALGYGAQGIAYFTYQQRPSTAITDGKNKGEVIEYFYNAPINLEGEKTAAWYYIKRINTEISKYNDIFVKCNSIRTINIFKTDLVNQKYSFNIGPFSEIGYDKDGVQISQIENKGNKYILIVNHDVQNYQMINLKGSTKGKVYKLTPDKYHNIDYNPISFICNMTTGHNFTLIPGGYLIFQYE